MAKRDRSDTQSIGVFKSLYRRSHHIITRLLVLGAGAAAVIVAFDVAMQSAASRHTPPCRYGDWSKPTILTRLASGTIVRNPILVSGVGATAYLIGTIGSTRLTPDDPEAAGRRLFSVDIRGKGISLPSGPFLFWHPLATLDHVGTLHLFWGEQDSVASLNTVNRDMLPVTSLWHATYTQDTGWSVAERIYLQARHEAPIEWNAEGAGVVVDTQGVLHLLVNRDGMRPMIHLMGYDGEWRAEMLPIAGTAPTIGVGAMGQLYISYIARRAPGRSPSNEVLMVRSNDAGRTWSPLTVISSLGQNHATGVRVFGGVGGIVHVMWGQNLSGGLFPEVIRHVISRDGGMHWSQSDDLQLPPEGMSRWYGVLDSCGSVHVAISSLVAGKPDASGNRRPMVLFSYARWSGSWNRPERPPVNSAMVEVALGVTGAGTTVLVGAAPRGARSERPQEFDIIESVLSDQQP